MADRRAGGMNWRLAGWGAAAGLLLVPLVAMRFTAEVDWDETDFLAFGAMLAMAGGGVELAVRASGSALYRAGAAIALATAFFLVWINLAVGMIGSEDSPANLLFLAVLAAALGGAAAAGPSAAGMARAMLAAAGVQAMIGLIAAISGWPTPLFAHGVFVMLWAASALLFRRAARRQAD